nr:hypothetical protein [uncultured Dysosmobacter sp.]
MENYAIKSVTFGGFDKQDVIKYIERTAQEQKTLQEENEALRMRETELAEKAESLSAQLERLTAEHTACQEALERETARRQELERLLPLEEEVERLRPDAQAYAQFRERIGAIECEARERAADLEAATAAQLRKTVRIFQEQYQDLMETFETAAAHVNGELRKVEVNLTQLPRALDQTGTELSALAARIDQSGQADRT